MLPSPVIKYSKINLKKTNILNKSKLNNVSFMYFKILNDINKLYKTIIENKEENKVKKIKTTIILKNQLTMSLKKLESMKIVKMIIEVYQ